MSLESELDIRWPIGLLFIVLGALVAVYGAVVPDRTHIATTLDNRIILSFTSINLNLVWGVVMVLFGAFMTWGARRASKRNATTDSAERRETAGHSA